MSVEVRVRVTAPVTCAELKAKREAFGDLFERTPEIVVENGCLTNARTGRLVAVAGKVRHVGRKYVTVQVDGRQVRVSPENGQAAFNFQNPPVRRRQRIAKNSS